MKVVNKGSCMRIIIETETQPLLLLKVQGVGLPVMSK